VSGRQLVVAAISIELFQDNQHSGKPNYTQLVDLLVRHTPAQQSSIHGSYLSGLLEPLLKVFY